MNRLEDKVAIITGATGGIGEATVDLFIKEGANVLMVDLSEDELISVSNKIGSNKLSYFQGDVSNASDNQRAVELAVERYGGCLLYTSPSPRDMRRSRMPSSA